MAKGSGFHNEASLCCSAQIRYFIVKDGVVCEPLWGAVGAHTSQWMAYLLGNSPGWERSSWVFKKIRM